jgi:hypothetical protein
VNFITGGKGATTQILDRRGVLAVVQFTSIEVANLPQACFDERRGVHSLAQEMLSDPEFRGPSPLLRPVRAMERGDGGHDLADTYDRVITPGGNALDALVATCRAAYGAGTDG